MTRNETEPTFLSKFLEKCQISLLFNFQSVSVSTHFDGRGNIRVGSGKFYSRDYDRTVEIECEFPSNNLLTSSIVWFKKSFTSQDYYPHYKGFYDSSASQKYQVKQLGPNHSVLIIRDFDNAQDNGVYRCFATRATAFGNHRETIFIETEVFNPLSSFGGSGFISGGSGGGVINAHNGCRGLCSG